MGNCLHLHLSMIRFDNKLSICFLMQSGIVNDIASFPLVHNNSFCICSFEWIKSARNYKLFAVFCSYYWKKEIEFNFWFFLFHHLLTYSISISVLTILTSEILLLLILFSYFLVLINMFYICIQLVWQMCN